MTIQDESISLNIMKIKIIFINDFGFTDGDGTFNIYRSKEGK